MSEDRIEGGLKKAGGKLEDAFGGLTGDPGRQAKGKVDQASGTAQDWSARRRTARARSSAKSSGTPRTSRCRRWASPSPWAW